MAHCQEKGWFYLISDSRWEKQYEAKFGSAFYGNLRRILYLVTRRHNKETRELLKDRNQYKFIPSNQTFDFLSKEWERGAEAEFYSLSFRMVRFEIAPDKYETIVTNCDKPVDYIKSLYARRWGIETAFRHLKYALGLVSFHAKKLEGILQEIFARLTFHNAVKMTTSKVIIPERKTKYRYKISFSDACYICRLFFRHQIPSKQVEIYIQSHLCPIRPDRQARRKVRYQTLVDFTYRIA
ncbi:transposase [Streptococcus suis]|uniref:transposase n=1 Tax=Streptococcus suis TaxID=1307 RepID=UPI0004175002|nr:transposase [Streptococcus suis]